MIANANLAVEDLLIGDPVLCHLGVDTKTLLEERRDLLDGIYCSNANVVLEKGGSVSRLMVACLNRVTDEKPPYVPDGQSSQLTSIENANTL